MKRPQQHLVDARGTAQLRAVFEPLGWVVNEIQDDYGVDFDIQIFNEGKATGEWFKVQLKSSEKTSYSASNDFISQELDYSHAVHYSTHMRDPIFLIHADVQTNKTFWYAPQLDLKLPDAPAQSNPPSTITLRIPTTNRFPETLREMLLALQRIRVLRGAKAIGDCSISEFASTIRKHADQRKLFLDFKDKLDAVAIQVAHDLFRAHLYSDAHEKLDSILQASDSSIPSKFSAILEKEQIEWAVAAQAGVPQSELPKIHLLAARRLQSLTRKGPPALKFHALIARKAAELEGLTFRDFGLYMNWRNQLEAGRPTVALDLYIERAVSASQVARKYNQCLRLARYASQSSHAWALPSALLRIVQGILSFTIKSGDDRQAEGLDIYVNSAMQICRLASDIGTAFQDDDSLYRVVCTSMLLYARTPEESLKCAQGALQKIGDADTRDSARQVLERSQARFEGEYLEGDRPATEAQIYENMAAALGIDMGDSTNPLTKLVQLGIKDANPGRVLKHCEHTFVSLSGRAPLLIGILAERLNLQSIHRKVIHCTLHTYAVERRSLDDALATFKQSYCDKCPDLSPRPVDWDWSGEWQEEQNKKHNDFMRAFRKGRIGPQRA